MKTSLTRRCSHQHILSTSAAALIGVVAVATSYGQAISITAPTTYQQNFDTLGTTTVAWSDGTTVAGWYAGINANATADGNLQATDGAGALTGLLNLGTVGDANRAIGSKATGTGAGFANIAYGVLFQNNSTTTLRITNFTYGAELWRSNSTAANLEIWSTFFKTSNTLFTDVEPGGSAATAAAGTFTALAAGNWTGPNAGAGVSLNGNIAPNHTDISVTNPNSAAGGIVIAPGAYLMFRWVDPNIASTDGYQGIDDVSIAFTQNSSSVWDLANGAGTAPDGVWDASATQYWLRSGVPSGIQAGDDVVFSQNGDATISVPANVTAPLTAFSNDSGTYTVGGVGQISSVFRKSGTGTVSLTSANSFSGGVFDGGTIRVAGSGALGSGTITLGASGGTLDTPTSATLTNLFAGSATLTKTGAGAVTLTRANTNTNTVINAGSINLTGSFPSGHTLTVENGARISGTGTVGGAATIANGGSVSAGVLGVGTLTFENLTFGAVAGNAATFDASLASSVNVTGSLVLNGGAGKVTINVSGNPVGALPQTFTLLDYVTIGGSGFGGFVIGTEPNRAVASLIDDMVNGRVDYQITSVDFPIWSGALSGAWALGVQGGAENWVLGSNNASPTDFRVSDNVVFNDLPATDQNVVINGANVTVTSLTFTNATRNYTFSGTNGIAGNAPLVKSGAATVTFENTNSFTGSVTVNAGTVKAASIANGGTDSSLGSGTLVTLDGGSTLEYTGASAASTNRALTIQAGGGTLKTANTLTLSGAISGAGTLTKTGAGRVIIAGTASATTTISEGVLELGAGANVTGALTVNNNTDLEISDGSAGTGNIINNGRTTIRRADTVTIPAIISGSGELIMNGAGSVTLGGAAVPNTFTGITRVLAGILLAGKTAGTDAIGGDLLIDGGSFRFAAVGTANQIPDTANITLTSGSFGDVLSLGPVAQQTDTVNNVTVNGGTFGSLRSGTSASFQINGLLNLAGGSVLLQRGGGISANTITAASGAVFQFDGGSTTTGVDAALLRTGPIQDSKLAVGSGGITVDNGTFNFNAGPSGRTAGGRGSTIILNGPFTSTGTTNILRDTTAGNLIVLQERSAIELNSAIRTFNVTGTLNLGTVAAPLAVRDGRLVIATLDPVPGPGGILKTGTGIVHLPGNQPYTGTTTIDGGTFSIDGTLSTSSVTINSTGTLTGKGSTGGGVTVNSGGSIVAGAAGVGTLTVPTLTLGTGAADTSSLTFNRGTTPGIISVANLDGFIVNGGADTVTVNLAGLNPGIGQHLLIDYAGILGGTGITAFKTGTLPNRVATAVVENDEMNTAIVLNITALEVPIWTGKVSTEWSTATIAAPKNWGLVGQPAATTDFLAQDNVLFDDTATLTDVALTGGDITPNSVRFNNIAKAYTVAGPGAITGAASVVKDGAGLVTLGGIHSYTGAVTMNAGTLQVASVTDVGGSSLGGAASTLVFNGGTLEYTGSVDTTARTITLSAGGGTVKTGTSLTLGGLVTGAGSLTKTGLGTTVLTAANVGFNGGLVLKEGTVQFATTDAIGGTTQTVTLDGGALEYTAAGTLDWGAAAQTRVIQTTATGGTIRVTAGAAGNGLVLTRAGSLTGAGPITKQGVGTLRVVAANAGFTGNWTVAEGGLEVQSPNALGSGAVSVGTGGILVVQSRGSAALADVFPNNVVLNGGTLQVRSGNFSNFGGDVDVQAPSFAFLRSFTSTAGSQDITISGRLAGSQSLTIQGNANNTATALILKNPGSNFSGQYIVNAAQGLTAQPPITGNPLGTGTIALTDARLGLHDDGAGSNGSIAYGNHVTIAGTVATTIDVNRSAGTTTGNTIHLGTLGMTSSTLNVTGANGYTVDFAGAADLGPSPTINATTGNISFSGGVNAAGPLTKQGAGKLTLGGTGTSTITGNVSILGGNLAINNTLADTSNVDVISGTLSGSGTVAGSVAVTAATGIVAPGNSAGILSVGGSITFGAAAAFNVELAHGAGPLPIAGTTYDQLNVGTGVLDGAVDITGATLNITTGADFLFDDLLFIIVNDGADPVAGTFANIPAAGTPFFVDGFMFEISYDADAEAGTLHGGNDVALLVPEPGSAALLLGGLGMLMGRRRRKA